MRYHEINENIVNEIGFLKKFGNRVLAKAGLNKNVRDKAKQEISQEKSDDEITAKVKKFLDFYMKNHKEINNDTLYNFLLKNKYTHDDIVKAFSMAGIDYKPLNKQQKVDIKINPSLNPDALKPQILQSVSKQKIQAMNMFVGKLPKIDNISVNMMSKTMLDNFSKLGYIVVKNMYKSK